MCHRSILKIWWPSAPSIGRHSKFIGKIAHDKGTNCLLVKCHLETYFLAKLAKLSSFSPSRWRRWWRHVHSNDFCIGFTVGAIGCENTTTSKHGHSAKCAWWWRSRAIVRGKCRRKPNSLFSWSHWPNSKTFLDNFPWQNLWQKRRNWLSTTFWKFHSRQGSMDRLVLCFPGPDQTPWRLGHMADQ